MKFHYAISNIVYYVKLKIKHLGNKKFINLSFCLYIIFTESNEKKFFTNTYQFTLNFITKKFRYYTVALTINYAEQFEQTLCILSKFFIENKL